jgi:replicative DNA helicase
MLNKLETMDAETLMTTPLEQLKFIVEGLIPQGLHILAGSPKIGKSWLSLWICLQVAKGEKVWSFETRKSEVVYLCLEDSFARIQNRLFEITDDAPSNLHFAIMSDTIGNGLEIQIENFIKEHSETGLIVIDTLQKIRNNTSANVNPYAADYDDINALKQIADKYKLAIVLVHHLRKTGDSDPLNMISGTSGIAGGADTNFVLQKDRRTENTAMLICTGRDIEQRELFLEFNKDTFLWELREPIDVEQKKVDEVIILLSDFIKSVGTFTGTATELVESLKIECNSSALKKKVIKHMSYLTENNILYSENRTFERREFTLAYNANDTMTDGNSPQNLPSTCQLPSAQSNLATVALCSPVCAENDDGVA